MIDKANIEKTNAWPFVEAKKILRERKKNIEDKGKIVLQTGYGPSGLPHIGTFGEVARTSMVVNALNHLADIPKEIITFSDDMDGLRKIPENIPNSEKLQKNLHKPLTKVPDPFEKYSSFGEHNNEMLKKFLNNFKFKYTFKSSTELYKSGRFDVILLKLLECYDAVMDVMLPTLGNERRATYSPFLPICEKTGRVLQAKVVQRDPDAGTIVYEDEEGCLVETPVTGGHCKLQWKADMSSCNTIPLRPDNVVHLYFLSILIIGLMTNQRISRQEISPSGDLILISAPIDMSIFCLSKILFAFILNIFMSLVVFATFLLISSGSFFSKLPNFVILAIFFLLGLSVILTMFSLMLERVKTEGQFMLIMVYPLIIPFLILSHNSLIEIKIIA